MKNIFSKLLETLLQFKKRLKELFLVFIKNLQKDFSFHNKHTELLAIWTVLFMMITGLFILAIKSNILIMFLFFIFAIVIMFAGAITAGYYLHALKYHNKKRLLPKIHNLLNKSFKLRTLLCLIKIPRLSIFDNIAKNLKLAQ